MVVANSRQHPELDQLSESELIDIAGDEWREILTPLELPEGRTSEAVE